MTHMKADDRLKSPSRVVWDDCWFGEMSTEQEARWAEAVLQEEARRQDIHDQYGKIVWNPPWRFWFVVLILAAFFGALLWWWLS